MSDYVVSLSSRYTDYCFGCAKPECQGFHLDIERRGTVSNVEDYTPPPKAVKHAKYLAEKISQRCEKKYLIGDAQHRGDLSRKNTLPMALEEAYDLPIYLITLEDNIKSACARLRFVEHEFQLVIQRLYSTERPNESLALQQLLIATTEAVNLLTIGNPEGLPEEER